MAGACTDVAAFLRLIGRNCDEYAAKIGAWDQLMQASSESLEELGVDDAKRRKYILRWVYYYRQGVEPWHIAKPVKAPRGPNWRY